MLQTDSYNLITNFIYTVVWVVHSVFIMTCLFRSLGLAVAPRIRFLKKLEKKQNMLKSAESEETELLKERMSQAVESDVSEDGDQDEGFTYHNGNVHSMLVQFILF